MQQLGDLVGGGQHAMRQSGRMNGNQLLGVLAAAHEVTELLHAGRRWWSAYDDWSP